MQTISSPLKKKPFFLSRIDLRPSADRQAAITIARAILDPNSDPSLDSQSLCLTITRDYTADETPSVASSVPLPGNTVSLAAGDSITVDIPTATISTLDIDSVDSNTFDGQVDLTDCDTSDHIDRVSFAFLRHNEVIEKSSANDTGNRAPLTSNVRYLRTIRSKDDFTHLSEGGVEIGSSAVKFIIDLERSDRIYFTRTAD